MSVRAVGDLGLYRFYGSEILVIGAGLVASFPTKGFDARVHFEFPETSENASIGLSKPASIETVARILRHAKASTTQEHYVLPNNADS